MRENDELDVQVVGAPEVRVEPIGFIWVTCRNGDHVLWISSRFFELEDGRTYEVSARLLESSPIHGERAMRVSGPLLAEPSYNAYAFEVPRTHAWNPRRIA